MKTFCWRLMLVNLMFVTNICSTETKLKYSRLKRDQPRWWEGASTLLTKDIFTPIMRPRPIVIYPEPQKPDFKKAGRRISETKCLEYIWEPTNRPKIRTYSVGANGPEQTLWIIGGRDALEKEFPHMGALGWKATDGTWIFKCGSSLISPKFTLTAAHCSKIPRDPTIMNQVPEIVRLGENVVYDVFVKGVHIDANISRITVHPQYSSPSKYYDIALIELESELRFSGNVKPVCLWNSIDMSRLGTKVTSTGWGVVNTTTRMTAVTLQAIEIEIIDSELCDRLLAHACSRHWCGVQENQLCAGKLAGGVDACQGDSGGPLQVKINLPSSEEGTMHYLIGVTSFGIGCARPNLPGVFTRVSSFIDWIESTVWPGE